eukprot:12919332-Prorocentrum_lima.AAC.1
MDITAQKVAKVKPDTVIYPDLKKGQEQELDSCFYWEIDLLSGRPFFQPVTREGGVPILDGS